jgi:hypothetical protein
MNSVISVLGFDPYLLNDCLKDTTVARSVSCEATYNSFFQFRISKFSKCSRKPFVKKNFQTALRDLENTATQLIPKNLKKPNFLHSLDFLGSTISSWVFVDEIVHSNAEFQAGKFLTWLICDDSLTDLGKDISAFTFNLLLPRRENLFAKHLQDQEERNSNPIFWHPMNDMIQGLSDFLTSQGNLFKECLSHNQCSQIFPLLFESPEWDFNKILVPEHPKNTVYHTLIANWNGKFPVETFGNIFFSTIESILPKKSPQVVWPVLPQHFVSCTEIPTKTFQVLSEKPPLHSTPHYDTFSVQIFNQTSDRTITGEVSFMKVVPSNADSFIPMTRLIEGAKLGLEIPEFFTTKYSGTYDIPEISLPFTRSDSLYVLPGMVTTSQVSAETTTPDKKDPCVYSQVLKIVQTLKTDKKLVHETLKPWSVVYDAPHKRVSDTKYNCRKILIKEVGSLNTLTAEFLDPLPDVAWLSQRNNRKLNSEIFFCRYLEWMHLKGHFIFVTFPGETRDIQETMEDLYQDCVDKDTFISEEHLDESFRKFREELKNSRKHKISINRN